ncbi:hypothetical protein [Streptomyces rubradiris]|uniref:hypothetical protein n=1 Tax=Streptomyces rubradiris TaxID=285531 RepID=UPI001942C79F|nr:hypothetical protein [Streptomyces rubradiris]
MRHPPFCAPSAATGQWAKGFQDGSGCVTPANPPTATASPATAHHRVRRRAERPPVHRTP